MKALITGASSGIGREFARLLAARGWDLIVAARSTDKLYELRDELSNVHVRVITIDLSREQDAYDLYEHLQEEHIDMLINNAGFGAYGFFADVPLQREIELIHTNVCSLHILTKLYLQDMLARGSGTILNVGSMAGFSAGPKLSSYYASKNYVVRLTEAIHEELRRAGSPVRVSCLCPGPTDTAFNKNSGVTVSPNSSIALSGHSETHLPQSLHRARSIRLDEASTWLELARPEYVATFPCWRSTSRRGRAFAAHVMR